MIVLQKVYRIGTKMAHIVINDLSDETDCETCGSSWVTGFEVVVDGEPFGEYTPSVGCISLTSYNYDAVFRDLLEHFGHIISVESVIGI